MPLEAFDLAAVGVPSLQLRLFQSGSLPKRAGAVPSCVSVPICAATPALRLTVVAVVRPQSTQSAVPVVVRFTTARLPTVPPTAPPPLDAGFTTIVIVCCVERPPPSVAANVT